MKDFFNETPKLGAIPTQHETDILRHRERANATEHCERCGSGISVSGHRCSRTMDRTAATLDVASVPSTHSTGCVTDYSDGMDRMMRRWL